MGEKTLQYILQRQCVWKQATQVISEECKRLFIDLHAQQTDRMLCVTRLTDAKVGQSCEG